MTRLNKVQVNSELFNVFLHLNFIKLLCVISYTLNLCYTNILIHFIFRSDSEADTRSLDVNLLDADLIA